MSIKYTLPQLGWSTFFQQQLSIDEYSEYFPARIVEQHKSRVLLFCERGELSLTIAPQMPAMTVGDWLLLNEDGSFYRLLERLTKFSRKASGRKIAEQLIAVNIDTVFITTALNADFSLNRIERYLALTKEAGASAVVVLTKADLCEQWEVYLQQVRALDPLLMVEVVNALDPNSLQALEPWYRQANTVAVVGSSGVGKSSLVNTLLNVSTQQTACARSADDKGRHTTTARHLRLLPSGGLIIDTPGMREIQLTDCDKGLQATFSDIETLANECRYSDCEHQCEPGCAVQNAISKGELEPRRLKSYLKLLQEQARNGASLVEKRAKDRSQSQYYRNVQNTSRQHKKGQ